MTKTHLSISPDLQLPLEAITNTHLILARRRVGKSYTGAVMAEEMIKAGLPWVAHDPTGVWWGLGSSMDGKSEGLPVIVIGGPHGHIPLEPSAGKVIANLVVDHPGWYIIDYSRFDHREEEIRFAADFGIQLYRRKQRKPSALHMFVDEADMFVPQKLPKDGKKMFDAFDAIVRRGGVYGLGITLITQRPSLVNKDVTTQCETLIALQTTAPQDQDPIFDWVSRNGTDEQLRQIKQSLASLKVGQAWYFSPDSDVFKLIKIRTRETFNSSATPKPGAKAIEPKVFASIDMAKLGEEINATVERSKQEDPEYLRRQVSQLKRELADRPATVVSTEPVIERIEVPVMPDAEWTAIENTISLIAINGQKIIEIGEGMKQYASGTQTILQDIIKTVANLREQPAPKERGGSHLRYSGRGTTTHFDVSFIPDDMVERLIKTTEGITTPQKRILNVLAELMSVGISQPLRNMVAFLSNQSPRSSGFKNNLGALRSMGLINYLDADHMEITQAGMQKAEDASGDLDSYAFQSTVLRQLPAPQARIIQILIQNGQKPMLRSEVARLANQSQFSSGYKNNLGALRSLGLLDYAGSDSVKPMPILWLE